MIENSHPSLSVSFFAMRTARSPMDSMKVSSRRSSVMPIAPLADIGCRVNRRWHSDFRADGGSLCPFRQSVARGRSDSPAAQPTGPLAFHSLEDRRETACGFEVECVENRLGVRELFFSAFVRSGRLDTLADQNYRQEDELQERLRNP